MHALQEWLLSVFPVISGISQNKDIKSFFEFDITCLNLIKWMAILNDLNNIIVWLDFVINVVNMYKGLFYTFTISHQCSPLNGNIIATATISITVTAK